MTTTLEDTPIILRFSYTLDPDDDDNRDDDGRDDVQLLSEDRAEARAGGRSCGCGRAWRPAEQTTTVRRDKRAIGLLISLCEWLGWLRCD
jgi:hypothetical protein